MLYIVSKNIKSNNDLVHNISIKESLEMIKKFPVVQFDTETTGLDCHINKLISLQFGYKDFKKNEVTTIIVDCMTISPINYKDVLENSYLIGHNLKFDLQFLYEYAIKPRKIYDTYICEKVLYLGYKPGKVSFKLGDVLYRYTGITIDKSFQSKIASKGLTDEGIIYSAQDVTYLQDIRKAQILIAKSRKCVNAFIVENNCVPAMAYLEWCGIKLDEKKWKEKMKQDEDSLEDYKNKLDEYVRTHTKLSKHFVSSISEPSLFDTVGTTYKPNVLVQWNSSKQVIPVLKLLGFDTTVKDKKTKKLKDTAEENYIANQKGIADDFLKLYFGYKGAEKNVSSYGQGHLNLINPITGRLHTVFNQIGTVTGRMSSGSNSKNNDLAAFKKLHSNDVPYVNLQNLPARGDSGNICRSCFIASEGNVFISCDYSAEESRVQADVWNEKSLLDAFAKGIDTHNLYAKLCFPDELKDINVMDVKKERADLRQAAKSAEFAVAYGSNGASIAQTIGMSVEKAMSMVKGLIKNMPGMAAFKKKTVDFLKKHGYIVINTLTGHRIIWSEWAEWRATEDRLTREFWENYKIYHKGTGDNVCIMVRQHMALAHDWFEKNVLNYPIQGGSAIVLKHAVAAFYNWIVDNNYFGIVKLCVLVHDEICAECPKILADKVTKALEKIMKDSASKFYKKLSIPAEASVGNHWIH